MHGHTGLMIILGFIAFVLLVGLILLVAAVYVTFKYRVPLRGVAAMGGALAFLASPLDLVQEAVLGPIALIDDVGLIGAVAYYVYRLIKAKQRNALRPNESPRSPKSV